MRANSKLPQHIRLFNVASYAACTSDISCVVLFELLYSVAIVRKIKSYNQMSYDSARSVLPQNVRSSNVVHIWLDCLIDHLLCLIFARRQ